MTRSTAAVFRTLSLEDRLKVTHRVVNGDGLRVFSNTCGNPCRERSRHRSRHGVGHALGEHLWGSVLFHMGMDLLIIIQIVEWW